MKPAISGLTKQRRLFRRNVVAVNRGRKIESGERVERKRIVAAAAKSTYRSRSGKRDLVLEFSVQVIDESAISDVLEIADKQFAANHVDDINWFRLFGNDVFPVIFGGGLWIEKEHATIRSLVICVNQKLVAKVIDDIETGIANFGDYRTERRIRLGSISVEQSISLFALAALGHIQKSKTSIVAGAHGVKPNRIGFVFKHEHVFRLRRTNLVIEDLVKLIRGS